MTDEAPAMQVPPSQQNAQGPAHKPGEPENWTKGIMSLGHQVAGARAGEEMKEATAIPPAVEDTGAKASSSGYENEGEEAAARPRSRLRK